MEDQSSVGHEAQTLSKSSKAASEKSDLFIVFAFSVIGLLVTLNLILRFPDFGAMIAQYNRF
jgi:hypothetical protein